MISERMLCVMEHIIEVSSTSAETPEGMWIILYNRVQLELESKKRQWNRCSHARAALGDKVKSTFSQYLRKVEGVAYEDIHKVYDKCISDLEFNGILEFRHVI